MKFRFQAPSPLMAVLDCFFIAEVIAPSLAKPEPNSVSLTKIFPLNDCQASARAGAGNAAVTRVKATAAKRTVPARVDEMTRMGPPPISVSLMPTVFKGH